MNRAYYKRPAILKNPAFKKGHAVIEASAGTGKTYTLEHLVLDLLIKGRANIEEILVVTFTEAATRELRERVRSLIRKILDQPVSLTEACNSSDDYWVIDDVIRGRLREALFRFDGAAISTIHGFCQRILSEQAFLGGRVFDQEHIDGKEAFGLAFREEVRYTLGENSPLQKELAGWIASGKALHELENFLYNCHREGVPERCPVTPTWDPVGLLHAIGTLPPLETLESAAENYYGSGSMLTGFKKHIKSLDQMAALVQKTINSNPQDTAQIINDWAEKTVTVDKVKNRQYDFLLREADKKDAPPIFKDLASTLEEIISRAASGTAFFAGELLPRVQFRFKSRKHALGLIDFDDMLLGVKEALAGPGGNVLVNLLRKRWKYALVDEFQDTDAVQWEIFKTIFVDNTDSHSLYVIGDPKQAIYGFRGADVHTYRTASEYLVSEKSASRLPLKDNFRSTEPLINSLNQIFTAEDSNGNSFFTGHNRYDEPVSCGNKERTACSGGNETAPVHLLHLYGEGTPLNSDSLKTGLACFISEEILRLTGSDNPLLTGSDAKQLDPIKLSDIYILTRTAAEGFEISRIMRRYNIAHAFYKQDGLFNTDEAMHVHRLLLAVDSPADRGLRMSAWLTPFFQVQLEELPAWQETGLNHHLTSTLFQWKRLADQHSWALLFDRIMSDSGLNRRLVFTGKERALTNYLHLFELLQAEAYSRPVTLAELCRSLKARIDGRRKPEGRESDIQRLETDREAVQILTMHKAKGLEAEVVFIGGGFGNPGLQGIKTDIYHREGKRCLHIGKAYGSIAGAVEVEMNEEYERLAYVALTRAKSRLYLPHFGKPNELPSENKIYGYDKLGVFYSKLQKQLDTLDGSGDLQDINLFQIRPVTCSLKPPEEEKITIEPGMWPQEDLLRLPLSRSDEVARLVPAHRGIILTSYSRISRTKKWQHPFLESSDSEESRDMEILTETQSLDPETSLAPAAQEDELPGGKETGLFLHSLLECIYPEEDWHGDENSWINYSEVTEQAEKIARRHGFKKELIPEALRLVYRAYKSPLHQESFENNTTINMPGGISSARQRQAEMSFAYPIPENNHPLISACSDPGSSAEDALPFKARRGYLQGLIDLVFKHQGKIYLLDWKSDRLPDFKLDTLNNHVINNYNLQAKVYTLALVRLLRIREKEDYDNRFGGIIYSFIRGIAPGSEDMAGEGTWYSLPSWEEVGDWELELLKRQEWGGETVVKQEGVDI